MQDFFLPGSMVAQFLAQLAPVVSVYSYSTVVSFSETALAFSIDPDPDSSNSRPHLHLSLPGSTETQSPQPQTEVSPPVRSEVPVSRPMLASQPSRAVRHYHHHHHHLHHLQCRRGIGCCQTSRGFWGSFCFSSNPSVWHSSGSRRGGGGVTDERHFTVKVMDQYCEWRNIQG